MPVRDYSLVVDGCKKCLACGALKPVSEFKEMVRKNRTGGPYYQPRCRACTKEYAAAYYRRRKDSDPEYMKYSSRKQILKRYGLTSEEYDQMLSEQEGKCAICGRVPEGNGVSRDNLVVDHDHATGKVRSLLCDFCNRGLGIFRDNPELLVSAALYLIAHSPERGD